MKQLLSLLLSFMLVVSLTACSEEGNADPAGSAGETVSVEEIEESSESVEKEPTITSISLDCNHDLQLDVKETLTIQASVLEEGADLSELKFMSSNPEVLTFEAQQEAENLAGLLVPKAEGTAEIYVTAGEVKSDSVTVTIVDKARIEAEQKAAEEAAAAKAAAEQKAAEEAAVAKAAAEQKAAEEAAAKAAAEQKAAEEAAAAKAAAEQKAAEEAAAAKAAAEQKAAKEAAAAKAAAEQKAAKEAAAAKAAAEQKAPQATEQGRTLYITPTGKRYHYDGNCNGGTYIPATMEEALARGLTPCKKCAGG